MSVRVAGAAAAALALAAASALDAQPARDRVVLPTIDVAGTTRCETRPDRAAHTVALSESVRDGIAGVARGETARTPFELRVAERLVRADGPFGGTRREILRTERVRAWEVASVARLDSIVWVHADGDSTTYHAPDGDALLSEAFLETHCFGIARRDSEGVAQIGLTFAPHPDRASPDVAGTIWIDSTTRALRVVEFAYTGVADSLPTGAPPNGSLAFAQLPGGAWYLRAWALRLPDAARPVVGRASRRPRDPARWRYVPFRERVGEAVPIESGARADARAIAVVSGRATDSTTGAALADGLVLIPGEPAARTDADGRYAVEVRGVPEGATEYEVTIAHDRIAALGVVDVTRRVTLRAGAAAVVDLAVPALATLVRRACGAGPAVQARGVRLRAGLAVGRLRTAGGAPLPDSLHLHAEWIDEASLAPRRATPGAAPALRVEVLPGGHFVVCPLPFDRDVVIEASWDGRVVATSRFRLPASGVALPELVLGEDVARRP